MGTTSNHHAPYDLGYTRATMAVTKRSEAVKSSRSQKSGLSSDCGLQPAHMKSELLVIADQHAAVRHTMGVDSTRKLWGNRKGPAA